MYTAAHQKALYMICPTQWMYDNIYIYINTYICIHLFLVFYLFIYVCVCVWYPVMGGGGYHTYI